MAGNSSYPRRLLAAARITLTRRSPGDPDETRRLSWAGVRWYTSALLARRRPSGPPMSGEEFDQLLDSLGSDRRRR